MTQDVGYFQFDLPFLSDEAMRKIHILRAQHEVLLIETLHQIKKDGWIWWEWRHREEKLVISHGAQIRLVDILLEMGERLYETAEAFFLPSTASEYFERAEVVKWQLLHYLLRRWRQLTEDLPLEPVTYDPGTETIPRSRQA